MLAAFLDRFEWGGTGEKLRLNFEKGNLCFAAPFSNGRITHGASVLR